MIMKDKINIAELLKDSPKGMELDCTMFENVSFARLVEDKDYPIIVRINGYNEREIRLTKEGCWETRLEAKCVIFPKGKTTWEGFVPPCKFKVGDKITNGKTSITIGYIDNEYYYEIGRSIATRLLIKNQDEWELIPNKFDINTLVPFESKVLVRDYDFQIWIPTFWGKYLDKISNCHYLTTNGCYKYCIPYEGNEHLLGTTDDCDEYFKTWK